MPRPTPNPRMNPESAVSSGAGQVAQLSAKTERELSDMVARLKGWDIAQQAWDDILAPAERAQLGNDLEAAWRSHSDTICMAAAAWECSYLEALIRLCDEFGSFDAVTRRRWRREAGLENANAVPTQPSAQVTPRSSAQVTPHWDGHGTLTYDGETVRKVRGRPVATHLFAILDAFQEQGWPAKIPDPLVGRHDSQRLREAVRTLNRRLTILHFRCDGSGEGICWELADHPRM
jgi:hypothetical protein